MIAHSYVFVRIVTAIAALWILLVVFLSFVGLKIWAPPLLGLVFIVGFAVELIIQLTVKVRRRR